jgi:hypothetical protein
MLSGYKTYLALLIAAVPEIISIVTTGLGDGLHAITIVGLVLAAIGRYVAKPK